MLKGQSESSHVLNLIISISLSKEAAKLFWLGFFFLSHFKICSLKNILELYKYLSHIICAVFPETQQWFSSCPLYNLSYQKW